MIVFCLLFAAANAVLGDTGAMHIKAAAAAYDAAKINLEKKSFDAAIKQFRQAIDIEPTFTGAYEGLVQACLDKGERLQAGAVITQLLEIEPDLNRYGLLLGQILLEEKQAEKALAQFSMILKRDPANADALFGFASAARSSGMEDRASDALEQGRKLHPQDGRFKIARGAPKSR